MSDYEQWWAMVDRDWDTIRSNVLPKYLKPEELVKADQAKADRDAPKLHAWFNEAWWRAPDTPEIHRTPGWGAMCDLCSEFD
jgi:hypothetical protein